jgi:hypothetical protein
VKAAALRAREHDVARRAVELTYEAVPAYAAALDATGRRRCEEDALFHVRFLVASLIVEDRGMFADYALWAHGLLARYGVAAESLAAMLRATADAVRELAPEDSDAAAAHVAAAEAALA